MKSICAVIFSLFIVCSAAFTAIAAEDSDRFKGKNVVIVLSSGDDIVAGAGLVMAKMAAGSGTDVTVNIAADAVKYAVKDSFHRFAPKNTTHREMLEAVIQKGGKVNICALCPSWLKLEKDDFIQGAAFAGALDVFDASFAENSLTLTF